MVSRSRRARPRPSIAEAADVLRRGGVVAYPTDTLYGLAVDPRSDDAVGTAVRAEGTGRRGGDCADRGRRVAGRARRTLRPARTAAGGGILAGPAHHRRAGRGRMSRCCSRRAGRSACACPRTRSPARWPRRFGGCITATSANRSGAAAPATPADVGAGLRRRHRSVLLDARARAGRSAVDDRRGRRSRSDAASRRGDRVGPRARIRRVMRTSSSRSGAHEPRERAALVGLFTGPSRNFDPEHSLDELAGLAAAAGADVALRVLQERAKPDPATFLGSGKVDVARAPRATRRSIDTVIFDNELSPAQLRNLEDRARAQGGRPHAADPRHLRAPRAHPRRQAAGRARAAEVPAAAAGRIGDRAVAAGRRHRHARPRRNQARNRSPADPLPHQHARRTRSTPCGGAARSCATGGRSRRCPTVALVGYTNAGKTTLFNLLTGGDAVASDALFVTLDPLVRKVKLPDRRELLVSDTVGFIERLPHSLVAAFRATLEEVAGADLLLHVIDAVVSGSRRGTWTRSQPCSREVGAERVPVVEVFNKCDRLDAGGTRTAARAASRRAVRVGADRRRARRGDRRDGDPARPRHRAGQRQLSRRTARHRGRGSPSSIASAGSSGT